MKHRILTEGQRPIRQKPYRIPPALKEEVSKELQELLEVGIVEKSTSEWSSPIVVVKKKDGTNQICMDYRKLNVATKFDAYPMLKIDEMLDSIGQSQFLTTLDLKKRYWQIAMTRLTKKRQLSLAPWDCYNSM